MKPTSLRVRGELILRRTQRFLAYHSARNCTTYTAVDVFKDAITLHAYQITTNGDLGDAEALAQLGHLHCSKRAGALANTGSAFSRDWCRPHVDILTSVSSS
jgi:hypothetical protein